MCRKGRIMCGRCIPLQRFSCLPFNRLELVDFFLSGWPKYLKYLEYSLESERKERWTAETRKKQISHSTRWLIAIHIPAIDVNSFFLESFSPCHSNHGLVKHFLPTDLAIDHLIWPDLEAAVFKVPDGAVPTHYATIRRVNKFMNVERGILVSGRRKVNLWTGDEVGIETGESWVKEHFGGFHKISWSWKSSKVRTSRGRTTQVDRHKSQVIYQQSQDE